MTLLLSICLIDSKTFIVAEDDNTNLLDQYYSLVENKKLISDDRLSEKDYSTESFGHYSAEFDVFNYINEMPEADVVAYSQSEELVEVISYDTMNEMYSYISVNPSEPQSMIFIVDGIKYDVSVSLTNITLTSSNNENLNILSFEPDEKDKELFEDVVSANSISVPSNGSWILMASGIRGHSSLYVKAYLFFVASGVQMLKLYVPSLEIYLDIAAGGIALGSEFIEDFDTVYDRYYMSDCTTYFREYTRYYNDGEYAGSGNSYFHSVRPDYAGQNCLAYV